MANQKITNKNVSNNKKKETESFTLLHQLMKEHGHLNNVNCEESRSGGGDVRGSKTSRKYVRMRFKKSKSKSKRKSKSKTKRLHKK